MRQRMVPAKDGQRLMGIAEDYLWKIMIRPRIVAALTSQGADLCHGRSVFDSTMAVSFFSSLGMFNSRSIKRR